MSRPSDNGPSDKRLTDSRATAAARMALALTPGAEAGWRGLCLALRGQSRLAEALQAGRRAVRLDPCHPLTHDNLAGVLYVQGDVAAAARHCGHALALAPAHPALCVNFGFMAMDAGALLTAIAWFERALALDGAALDPRLGLAACLRESGDFDGALAACRAALARHPRSVTAYQNTLMTLLYAPQVTAAQLAAAHRGFAGCGGPAAVLPPAANPRDPDRRLVVGYVSGDFRDHPVGGFLAPVLAAHDPSAVRVLCYSENPFDDGVTARLRGLAAGWRSIAGLDDGAAAAQIRADGVDVLVDLAGHTAHNRLPLFALRPAPVQVSWLGYPAGTGEPAIAARVTDAAADPPGVEAVTGERLLRLAGGFLCYEPPAAAPPPAPLPALARGRVTFGSFNTPSKLNPAVIALWAALLRRVPGSRLCLKSRGLGDAGLVRRLTAAFAGHGVDADRLDLRGWSADAAGHFAAYNDVDIALDPFPYNGTTTSCDALWMGAPLVTLAGDRHAGRVGVSLLTALDLPGLIAADPQAYVEIAAGLAADRARLAALRAGLRPRMAASSLCDAPGLARRLEAAWRTLWREWCGMPYISGP